LGPRAAGVYAEGMSEGGPDQRRETRHAVKLPATLVRGKKEPLSLLTQDVSFRGLFVRTDTPPALRQLVKIEIAVPPDHRKLLLHGMVVHVIRPDADGIPADRAPGAGIELMTLDGDVKDAWEGFIRHVQPRRAESLDRMQVAAAAHAVDPVRRRFQRHKAELQLLFHELGDLQTLVTRDVSQGGMFVATELPLPVGHELEVTLVHPDSARTIVLDCVIRRRDRDATPPGVGIELVHMDEGRRRAFVEFVKDDVPMLDATEEEISDDELEFIESEEPTNKRPRTPT
jgi:Tfp pilus assembly protein PilZ